MERLYELEQVAQMLGARPVEVVDWIRQGLLSVHRLPNGPACISSSSILRFIKQQGIDIASLHEEVEPAEDASQPDPIEAAPATHGRSAIAAIAEDSTPSNGDGVSEASTAEQVGAAILHDAAAKRAASLILETSPNRLALRLRIDGVMIEEAKLRQRVPVSMGPGIVEHLCLLAPKAGSGSFCLPIDGRDIRFDLSACTTDTGRRVIIRLNDPAVAPPALAQLGLTAEDESALRAVIAMRCGLVVVAAPPRSGRRATLSAMAAEADLARCDAAVVSRRSSRDFGEHGPAAGRPFAITPRPADAFVFADALGAAVEQDADVVVLDDLRDLRSIQAALHAALDGRLVLASMQVPRAIDALRLLLTAGDLAGLDRWEMALAIKALITQRSIRKLCPTCRAAQSPASGSLAAIGLNPGKIDFPTFGPRGCPQCASTGYAGMAGIFAVAVADLAMADLLRGGAELAEIESAVPALRPEAILNAALAKVREGTTGLDEIARCRL